VGGESSSVHQEAATAAAWKDTILLHLLSKYMAKDISNVNECELFYNTLLDKNWTFKREIKQEKNHCTSVCQYRWFCEFPFLVARKPKQPHYSKNIKSLPTD
jgi:hypothetical protein